MLPLFDRYEIGPKWKPVGMAIVVLLISLVISILASLLSVLIGYNRLNPQPEMHTEIASLIGLVPLCLWYVWKGRKRVTRVFSEESKKRSVILLIVLIAFSFLRSEIGIIFAVVLTIIVVEGYKLSSFGFHLRRGLRLLWLGGFLLVVSVLPILLGLVLRYGLALFSVLSNVGFDFVSLPLTLLYAVFVIGVAEEGFYRGYVQTKLGRIIGFRRALLVQAVLFAAWHFDPRYAVEDQVFRLTQVFLFGVLVGVYYWQTRSLVGTAFFHGLWDTFVFNERGLPIPLFHMPITAIIEDLLHGKVFVLLGNLLNDFTFIVGISSIAMTIVMCLVAGRVCVHMGVRSTQNSEEDCDRIS